MRITRTIKYPGAPFDDQIADHEYPIYYLPEDDHVRVGFEKGILLKATFELANGRTIIYEGNNNEVE